MVCMRWTPCSELVQRKLHLQAASSELGVGKILPLKKYHLSTHVNIKILVLDSSTF
jgi:hypothetical protein